MEPILSGNTSTQKCEELPCSELTLLNSYTQRHLDSEYYAHRQEQTTTTFLLGTSQVEIMEKNLPLKGLEQ